MKLKHLMRGKIMDKELNEVYRKSLKKHLENPKRAKILVYRYYKA